jgi:hypothetical protein
VNPLVGAAHAESVGMKKRYPLGNYGLSIVLACLFVLSWVAQTWFGWREFQSQQQEHGQVASWFGKSGYVWTWGAATFENWQSEFLQLLTFVVLTAILIHRHSHESRDNDDEVGEQLNRIERKIEALEKRGGRAA